MLIRTGLKLPGVSSTKQKDAAIFVEPTPAEAHWQMGQVENSARYLRQMGYRIVEDIDVSQSDFQTMLHELTDAKNSQSGATQCVHAKTVGVQSDSSGARTFA